MPYARVSVMPQPPGAADDSGNESRKGSQQQPQAAGITMQVSIFRSFESIKTCDTG